MTFKLGAILLLSLVLTGTASTACGTYGCSVSRAPFVRFGDVTYFARYPDLFQDAGHDSAILGPEFRKVTFEVTTDDCDYKAEDGHAASLKAGTPLYSVDGYRPEFLLGAVLDGRIILYEAGYVRNAKRGGDLLDLRDRVSAIGIGGSVDGAPETGRVEDAVEVASLTRLILEAEVNYEREYWRETAIMLSFYMTDGLVFTRPYYPSSGAISPGIYLPAAAKTLITNAQAKRR